MRNGADYTTIRPDGAPSIRCNKNGSIKTSFSGKFLENNSVNWLTDQIRPEIIIDDVTYSLGVFLPATVRHEETETQRLVTVDAYDRCWIVRDNYTDSLVYYAAGTNYLEPVKELLASAGIALIVETPTAATLATDREDWRVGTSYLTIINQLLSEINYHELWFNADGAAVLEPVSVPTAENIEHTLDNGDIRSLMLPRIKRQTDLYKAPNYFIVICANPDKNGSMVATAENSNPQSELSTVRRGRKIVGVVNVDNIANQTELQEYANRIRNESMITGETIEVTTALFPGFGVNDVTAISYNDLFAICLESQWEMHLDVGGEMKHTLERVVVNIG
jgi:hypothetical protein